jgi:hypothetical protein
MIPGAQLSLLVQILKCPYDLRPEDLGAVCDATLESSLVSSMDPFELYAAV